MASTQLPGICALCGDHFGKRAMPRHLSQCTAGKSKNRAQTSKASLLFVDGKPFWLYVAAAPSATLADLDQLLRDTWLECCGHLSQFLIHNLRYLCYAPDDGLDWDEDARTMDATLAEALTGVSEFWHEYDFGSTTGLLIKPVGSIPLAMGRNRLRIVARNLPPQIRCSDCGDELATQICSECYEPGTGFLCDECAGEHEHGEEMILPFANSPRAGICAYTGKA